MALVACKECGGKVADSASACPHCGVDAPAGVGQIIIQRRSQLQGRAVKTWLALNGEEIGEIGPGEGGEFRLKPGLHIISLSWASVFSRLGESVEVRVAPGATTYVEIEGKMGIAHPKFFFHVS